MILLATLLATAMLAPAPAPSPELRTPGGALAPTATTASCPCGDALREPFAPEAMTPPRAQARPLATASTMTELRDPFDAPRRTAAQPVLRAPAGPRPVRPSTPKPTDATTGLRSPFGR